jgi:hypothetical protein
MDLFSERLRISFPKLAQREGVHLSTVWRWAIKGVRGHKLESFSVGSKKFTTEPAYARFLSAINGQPIIGGETPTQRAKRVQRAERRAESMGV